MNGILLALCLVYAKLVSVKRWAIFASGLPATESFAGPPVVHCHPGPRRSPPPPPANGSVLSQSCSMALKVCVASTNPVKINCVAQAFAQCFPEREVAPVGVSVASGVADQPMSDEETLTGARTRAANARAQCPDAAFWVGVEGGLCAQGPDLVTMAWIYVVDAAGKTGQSRTATFTLPQRLVELIRQGHELGVADDMLFQRRNSKAGSGTVGVLTGGVVDRTEYYRHACVLALVPFLDINKELY